MYVRCTITDVATKQLALVIRDDDAPEYWARVGWEHPPTLVIDLVSFEAHTDPFEWQNGTLFAFHHRMHFDEAFAALVLGGGTDEVETDVRDYRDHLALQGQFPVR